MKLHSSLLPERLHVCACTHSCTINSCAHCFSKRACKSSYHKLSKPPHFPLSCSLCYKCHLLLHPLNTHSSNTYCVPAVFEVLGYWESKQTQSLSSRTSRRDSECEDSTEAWDGTYPFFGSLTRSCVCMAQIFKHTLRAELQWCRSGQTVKRLPCRAPPTSSGENGYHTSEQRNQKISDIRMCSMEKKTA